MRWMQYARLSLHRASLDQQQERLLAQLDREDERIGNRIAGWELPAILSFHVLLLFLLGLFYFARH